MGYKYRILAGAFVSLTIVFALFKYYYKNSMLITAFFFALYCWYRIGWFFRTDKEISDKIDRRIKNRSSSAGLNYSAVHRDSSV